MPCLVGSDRGLVLVVVEVERLFASLRNGSLFASIPFFSIKSAFLSMAISDASGGKSSVSLEITSFLYLKAFLCVRTQVLFPF
ncbi:unnamed protein product [Merluccius merluccius]